MDKKKKCFKKGDTILTDKPFVHALKSTFKNEKCDFCFSEWVKCFTYINNIFVTKTYRCLELPCPDVQAVSTFYIAIASVKSYHGQSISENVIN